MIAERIACLIGNFVTAAACVLLVILYFEGVPLVRSIPMIGHVPLFGWIAQGEIGRRLEGYVALSEKTALEAQIAREKRLRAAAEAATAGYQKRASEAEKAKDEADAKIRQMEADDSGEDGARWGADDVEWLRHH